MSTTPIHHARKPETKLYALGSNANGQLGIAHRDDCDAPQLCLFSNPDSTVPMGYVPLNDNEVIGKIVAGGNHSLLLTTEGRLWSTGSNNDHQRGFASGWVGGGEERNVWREHDVKGLITDKGSSTFESASYNPCTSDIAATFSASFFVIAQRLVYSCGTGFKGELGIGGNTTTSPTPILIFDLRTFEPAEAHGKASEVISISASMSHVIVLSSSGSMYGWGASRKGQLGEHLRPQKSVWEPCKLGIDIGTNPHNSQIATGKDFTLIIRHDSGRIRQIFLGDAEGVGIEIPMPIERVFIAYPADDDSRVLPDDFNHEQCTETPTRFQAGWTTVGVVSCNGTINTFGKSHRAVVAPPLHDISMFAMGSEHCVGVGSSGGVVAWGWGEHGNCGKYIDTDEKVRNRCNNIFTPHDNERVAGTAAGCATTFFWTLED